MVFLSPLLISQLCPICRLSLRQDKRFVCVNSLLHEPLQRDYLSLDEYVLQFWNEVLDLLGANATRKSPGPNLGRK